MDQESKYAIAQISSKRENSNWNIEKHLSFASVAAREGAKVILFPEMSLTGYEQEIAKRQHFTLNDKRFESIQKLCDSENITIIAGAPIEIDNNLYVSSVIFNPKNEKAVYIKKNLHISEEQTFSTRSDYDPIISIQGQTISNAICYDIEIEKHIEQAVERGSNKYLASIFYSKAGIGKGLQRLQEIASRHHVDVLMANYVGIVWDTEAGGKSCMLSKNGDKIIEADSDSECLIIVWNLGNRWDGNILRQN